MRNMFSISVILGICCLLHSTTACAQTDGFVDKSMTEKVAELIAGDVSLIRSVDCAAASAVGVKRALNFENGDGAARGYRFAEQTWREIYTRKGGSQQNFERDYEQGTFSKVVSSGERGVINGHIVNCMNELMPYLQSAKKAGAQ